MPLVELNREPVELYKLLKFEGLAASGGEAKALIANGHVKVNGQPETRKRKKIVAGDTIEFNDETYTVALAQ
jgi:ribosome-associated protein